MPRLLLLLSGAQAAGILAADRRWIDADGAFALGVATLCAGALVPRLRPAASLVLALAAGALALSLRLEDAARARPLRPFEAVIEGRIATLRVRSSGALQADLEDVVAPLAASSRIPRRLHLVAESAAELPEAQPGDRLRLRARLRAPGGARNPGRRDARRRLERAGIAALARPVHPRLVSVPATGLLRPLWHARARAAERLAQLGPGGGLLAALALGDRRGLDDAVRDRFARLGIAHLLAVSGLHLALVAATVFGIARRVVGIGVGGVDPRRRALVVALGAALVYAVATGAAIPVRRALVFLAAWVTAALRGRPTRPGPPLALAALVILAVEPQALFDTGAQLSFAAAGGLVCAVRGGGPGGLAATAIAFAVTAPLAAHGLGVVAPAALLANAVAIPLTAFVLLPAAFAALVGVGAGLAERAAAGFLAGAEAAASWCPGPAAAAPGAAALIVAVGLAGVVLRCAHPGVRLAAAFVSGLVLAFAGPDAISPEPPRVVVLDVGQGDAVLVQGREGAVLVDAGAARAPGFDRGRDVVVPALVRLGVRRLDLVVATHADNDHRGGLPAVLSALPVDRVWLPPGGITDVDFAPLRAAAARRGALLSERAADDPPARFGDVAVAALWPPRGWRPPSRNHGSLVLRFDLAGRRVLLPGDVPAAVESALVAARRDLAAEVLLLPHHGSRTSSSPGFLAAVGAAVHVASAPCAGRFGMPHPEVTARVRVRAGSLRWTGREGAVLVGLGRPLWVRAWGAADCPWPGSL